jgi:hypothetical protein
MAASGGRDQSTTGIANALIAARRSWHGRLERDQSLRPADLQEIDRVAIMKACQVRPRGESETDSEQVNNAFRKRWAASPGRCISISRPMSYAEDR